MNGPGASSSLRQRLEERLGKTTQAPHAASASHWGSLGQSSSAALDDEPTPHSIRSDDRYSDVVMTDTASARRALDDGHDHNLPSPERGGSQLATHKEDRHREYGHDRESRSPASIRPRRRSSRDEPGRASRRRSRSREDGRHSRSRDHHRSSSHRRDKRSRHAEGDTDSEEEDHHHRSKRHHSRSPPRSSKLLVDDAIVPIHERQSQLKNWDVAPVGYEGMTAPEVKATGMFPLPGASNKLPTSGGTYLPSASRELRAKDFEAVAGALGSSDSRKLSSQSRLANVIMLQKRIFCSNLPAGSRENHILEFFNNTMIELGLTKSSGKPVTGLLLNKENRSAFIEFRNSEEATSALAFDGMSFQGETLSITRPSAEMPDALAVIPISTERLFITRLPKYLHEEHVNELVSCFGLLKSLHVIVDSSTQEFKGFAYFEFEDPDSTSMAVEGLNGLEIDGQSILIRRCSNVDGLPGVLPDEFMLFSPEKDTPTSILLLLNFLPVESLTEKEYQEVLSEVQDEASKFGKVESIVIPKVPREKETPFAGKAYIKFGSPSDCSLAYKALAGRKFCERTLITSYFSEDDFEKGYFF